MDYESTVDEAPIKRPRVSDQIVERLEKAIRSGAYKIGETLPSERELMKRYGVGRPAVREALFTLSKRGIIEVRSGSRPQVKSPDASIVLDDLSSAAKSFLSQPQGVGDFQQIRELLEVALVRNAARNATDEEIETLRRALAANRAALGDRAQFIRSDIEFHYVLAKRTGNPIIMAIHSAMTRWLYEQRKVALQLPGIEQVSYAGHEAIFKGVAKHDPDLAEAAMHEHLGEVARNYWAARGRNSGSEESGEEPGSEP